MKIFGFLNPAPHIERLPAEQVDEAYKMHRRKNFIGIFIGYACYYLLRKHLAIAIPFLTEAGFSKTQLGWCLSAISIAYGISKFIMGNLSDRSNPRYFIVTGLVISVVISLIFSLVPSVTTFVPGASFTIQLMFALMLIHGWAQGMGAPPCYRTVAHWFSTSKRGRTMAVWNVSHNIGAALLGGIAFLVIPLFGWKSTFYIPSLIVAICAVIIIILMRDTPQSVGLMPVEEYSNEYSDAKKKNSKDRERELTAKEILFKYVLVNKYVWLLGLANIFVYFIRYGVIDWAPTYLAEMKGLGIEKGGVTFILYEMPGILGMLLCGYVSDKLFRGRRAPVSILCMVMVFAGILLYWLGNHMYMNLLGLVLIGTFIYGPVMLVGVQVLDLMPKKAVGTTIGLLGLFGYWGGNMTASAGIGVMVDHWGWNSVFMLMTISCILATIFFSSTLRVKSHAEKKAALEAA